MMMSFEPNVYLLSFLRSIHDLKYWNGKARVIFTLRLMVSYLAEMDLELT